jgi:GT2 family glycosyltransferase
MIAGRTVDLLSPSSRASPVGGGSPLSRELAFAPPIGGGWYRAKIAGAGLRRVGIVACGADSVAIGSFETSVPGRFAGYIHAGAPVARLRFRLDGATQDLAATLRPIGGAEFLWQALRHGGLKPPRRALSYFNGPPEPFIVTLRFPRPPRFADERERYAWWIANREAAVYRAVIGSVASEPREHPPLSILLAVADARPDRLRDAIASVVSQSSPRWQLVIAVDTSADADVHTVAANAAGCDSRATVVSCDRRDGPDVNAALHAATSPFVTTLLPDDRLAPLAVEAIGAFLRANPATRLLYADEDRIDGAGVRQLPYFKSDFSRELFYSTGYVGSPVVQAETVRSLGGWRTGEATDFDLALRVLETANGAGAVGHVPLVLCHRRADAAARTFGFGAAVEAARRALADHFARCGVAADVVATADQCLRVRYCLPDPPPRVSIIIPFRDRADLLARCLASIERTTRPGVEIVLVDNGSREAATHDLVALWRARPGVTVLSRPGVFNFSALNNDAAEAASGEYLCFLNNDTEAIAPGWLDDMVGYAMQDGVGCVGAKLYDASSGIQHAGIVLGGDAIALHAFRNRPSGAPGYFGRLRVASNYAAVTGACMVAKRSIFVAAGGFDARSLPVAFSDVDLCLRVGALGYRNVVTPFAELSHFEAASRDRDDAPANAAQFNASRLIMMERHGATIRRDPFYSPHLARGGADFSIATDD